jgi:putative transposase
VLSWRLSNSLDAEFCIEALEDALRHGRPEIFNTDQGSQFTSLEFTSVLKSSDVAISMDGKGRAIDNVMIERLWRTVKYEDAYLKEYFSGADCYRGLRSYFDYYDHERRHQSLERKTPGKSTVPTDQLACGSLSKLRSPVVQKSGSTSVLALARQIPIGRVIVSLAVFLIATSSTRCAR